MVVGASPFPHADSSHRQRHEGAISDACRAMTPISIVAAATMTTPQDGLAPEDEKIINRWEPSLGRAVLALQFLAIR